MKKLKNVFFRKNFFVFKQTFAADEIECRRNKPETANAAVYFSRNVENTESTNSRKYTALHVPYEIRFNKKPIFTVSIKNFIPNTDFCFNFGRWCKMKIVN